MHLETEFDNRDRERNAYTNVWKSFNSVSKQTSIKNLGREMYTTGRKEL